MKKKIVYMLCFAAILAFMSITVMAEEGDEYLDDYLGWIADEMDFYNQNEIIFEAEDRLWVDNYGGSIWFDGRYITPQLIPFIQDDSSMIPFRAVVEELLNGTVDWDEAARKVTAEAYGQEINFFMESADILITIVNDRIFVPVEVIITFFLNTQ